MNRSELRGHMERAVSKIRDSYQDDGFLMTYLQAILEYVEALEAERSADQADRVLADACGHPRTDVPTSERGSFPGAEPGAVGAPLSCPNGHRGTFTVEQQVSTLLSVPPRVDANGAPVVVKDPNTHMTSYRCDTCGVQFSVESNRAQGPESR